MNEALPRTLKTVLLADVAYVILDQYRVVEQGGRFRLFGAAYGHPNFTHGTLVTSSDILSVDMHQDLVRKARTTYSLHRPLTKYDQDFLHLLEDDLQREVGS